MSPYLLSLIGLIAIPYCYATFIFNKTTGQCYISRKGTSRVLGCPKLVNDRFFDDQWVLVPRPVPEFDNRTTVDLGILEVWINKGYLGQNITVSVNDNGVESSHPELRPRFKSSNNYMPSQPQNFHGTSVAGIIGMEINNGLCGVGVAPKVSIVSARVFDSDTGTMKTAGIGAALTASGIDITVNSINDTPDPTLKVDEQVLNYLRESVSKGRRGLGIVHLFSAGNVGVEGNTCSFQRFASNIYTISVAAVTPWGETTMYSGRCSAIMVTAPSSPDMRKFLVTAAVGGACTTNFGGVSSSVPIAGGILAIAMNANSRMTWRDWQHALAFSSSRRYLDRDAQISFRRNGAGFWTSLSFGFGLISAVRLVERAIGFSSVPEMHTCRVHVPLDQNVFGPPEVFVQGVYTDGCLDSYSNRVYYLEHVQLRLEFTFHNYGELQIDTISPSGTTTNLLVNQHTQYYVNQSRKHEWIFDSVHTWGEVAMGYWQIVIQTDAFGRTPGRIHSCELILYGTAEKPKHYTLKY